MPTPIKVPPVPLKAQIADDSGYINFAWSQFFTLLYTRIGGVSALSNIDLETLQTVDLSALTATVAALSLTVTSQGNSITTLQTLTTSHTAQLDDLRQGPVL